MLSGIHILDSCLRAWGKGKHLELNAEHMLKLLIRSKKKQCIILSEDSKTLIQMCVFLVFLVGIKFMSLWRQDGVKH